MDTLIKKTISILKLSKSRPRSLSRKEKIYFLQVLAEMLEQGFSINQSLHFLKILLPRHQALIDQILQDLMTGVPLEQAIKRCGYSSRVSAQLFFAQKQGRFIQSLFDLVKHLRTVSTYQDQLAKLLLYPACLILFLTGILFGMRQWMLPQILSFISEEVLQTQMLARVLIIFFTYLPQMTLSTLALSLITYIVGDFYLLRLPQIKRYQLLVKFPFIKKLVKKYTSYRIAAELGYFFLGGFSIQQILDLLIQYPQDPFLTDLAHFLKDNYLKGVDLASSLDELAIFTDSLALVIYQGELTNQTGQKCRLYAQKLFEEVMEDVSRKLNMIQPILFIAIALIIMSMYLVLMLPMLTMEI